jgi:hypothetical protein
MLHETRLIITDSIPEGQGLTEIFRAVDRLPTARIMGSTAVTFRLAYTQHCMQCSLPYWYRRVWLAGRVAAYLPNCVPTPCRCRHLPCLLLFPQRQYLRAMPSPLLSRSIRETCAVYRSSKCTVLMGGIYSAKFEFAVRSFGCNHKLH